MLIYAVYGYFMPKILSFQEKAYNDKIASLEEKSQNGGLVSRNKAKHELAQVKEGRFVVMLFISWRFSFRVLIYAL